jgi:hypothetical protein
MRKISSEGKVGRVVYLFTPQGRGGQLTREKVRGATVHKAGSNSKIPT